MGHSRRIVRRNHAAHAALLIGTLAGLQGCAPYRGLSRAGHTAGAQTVFCQGPGSSRAPGNRTTTDCFYVDRTDLERFMNGRLRL